MKTKTGCEKAAKQLGLPEVYEVHSTLESDFPPYCTFLGTGGAIWFNNKGDTDVDCGLARWNSSNSCICKKGKVNNVIQTFS